MRRDVGRCRCGGCPGIVDEEVGDAADIELAVEVAGCVDELVAVHRELLHLF